MALSILKQKINKREYKSFAEFVRDCALVRDTYLLIWLPLKLTSTSPDLSQCADLQPTQIAGIRGCASDQGMPQLIAFTFLVHSTRPSD